MPGEPAPTVLFVCLHGSAKSLIAAEHFNRLARERGLELRAESAGLEPESEVPEAVASGLLRDGIDVRAYVPRAVTADRIDQAKHLVSFGCALPSNASMDRTEHWDDMPLVSDGFERARDAIVRRVERMIAQLG